MLVSVYISFEDAVVCNALVFTTAVISMRFDRKTRYFCYRLVLGSQRQVFSQGARRVRWMARRRLPTSRDFHERGALVPVLAMTFVLTFAVRVCGYQIARRHTEKSKEKRKEQSKASGKQHLSPPS